MPKKNLNPKPKTAAKHPASGDRSAATCSLEVEISESKRRYITIEVTPDQADRICEWTMKYNPSADETQRAIDMVKAAKVTKEEVMHDCYELGCDDGYHDDYEDDPLWFDPGDESPCDTCHGMGIIRWCPAEGCGWQWRGERLRSYSEIRAEAEADFNSIQREQSTNR